MYAYYNGSKYDAHVNQFAVYPLLGKYDTLTFEAYKNNYDKSNVDDITIKIYGDGTELKSVNINKDVMPATYTVDITNVQKLKIEFVSKNKTVANESGKLPGELANVIVSKTK